MVIEADNDTQELDYKESGELFKAAPNIVGKLLEKLGNILALGVKEFDDSSSFKQVSFEGESFLHILIRKPSLDDGVSNAAYQDAMDKVLTYLEKEALANDISKKRILALLSLKEPLNGRTVLHIAPIQWENVVVLRLLKLGADISAKDKHGHHPLSKIDPQVLKDFLDTKWKAERNCVSEEYTITFDFQFLIESESKKAKDLKKHTIESNGNVDRDPEKFSIEFDSKKAHIESNSNMDNNPEKLSIESDSKKEHIRFDNHFLQFVTQSLEHRELILTHPVVTTFIALRWEEVAFYYSLNIFFTFFTGFIVNLFVLINYGGESVDLTWLPGVSSRANWTSCNATHPWSSWSSYPSVFNDSGVAICWIILLMCTVATAVREAFQFNLENWMELIFIMSNITLITFTAIAEQPVCAMRALAATSLLISWILFLKIVARSRIPTFRDQNIHITMFLNVMKKFVWIFIIFAPYILAFGLFFYISLHKDVPQGNGEATETSSDDNQKKLQKLLNEIRETKHEIFSKMDEKAEFLDKVGFSMLKTVAMFVGELEFNDFPFNNLPYFSHVAFLFFIFSIVIVLMNLLTGLAVGETAQIQAEAEVCAQETRVMVIHQVEKLPWCNPKPLPGRVQVEKKAWSSWWSFFSSCESGPDQTDVDLILKELPVDSWKALLAAAKGKVKMEIEEKAKEKESKKQMDKFEKESKNQMEKLDILIACVLGDRK